MTSTHERLTERDEFGNADITGVDSMDLQMNLSFDEFNLVTKALNKLAAYEDTGLTPERCAELAEAQRNRMLLVLPFKVVKIFFVESGLKSNLRKDGKYMMFLTRAEAEAVAKKRKKNE